MIPLCKNVYSKNKKAAANMPLELIVGVVIMALVIVVAILFLRRGVEAGEEGLTVCTALGGVYRSVCNSEVSYPTVGVEAQKGMVCCVARSGKQDEFLQWTADTTDGVNAGVAVGEISSKDPQTVLNTGASNQEKPVTINQIEGKIYMTFNHQTFALDGQKGKLVDLKQTIFPDNVFRLVTYNQYADGECIIEVGRAQMIAEDYVWTSISDGSSLSKQTYACKKGSLAVFDIRLQRIIMEPKAYVVKFTVNPNKQSLESKEIQGAVYVDDENLAPPRRIQVEDSIIYRQGKRFCFVTAYTQELNNRQNIYSGTQFPSILAYQTTTAPTCNDITTINSANILKNIQDPILPSFDGFISSSVRTHCLLFSEPKTDYYPEFIEAHPLRNTVCDDITVLSPHQYNEEFECSVSCSELTKTQCSDYTTRLQGCAFGLSCYWDSNSFFEAGTCRGCLGISRCVDYTSKDSCLSNECVANPCVWNQGTLFKKGECQDGAPEGATCETWYSDKRSCDKDVYTLGCSWDASSKICKTLPATLKKSEDETQPAQDMLDDDPYYGDPVYADNLA